MKVALPKGMKLSVPYNHRLDLLEALNPFSRYLAFLFLPFHPTASLSARAFTGRDSINLYELELIRVANWCQNAGVGLNLLANAPSWALDPEKVSDTLVGLRAEVSKLKVTFADLHAAREVKSLIPWLSVGVSCLADVQTPVGAMWWQQEVSATALTVSREINRAPRILKALAKSGMTLSVVAFDDCVPGCQARSRHFVPAGDGDKKNSLGRFVAACDPGSLAVRKSRPWLLAQKEILPGHLKYLQGIVPEIKISGRNMSTSEIMRRVGLYLEAESLTHPNGFYSEPDSAWQHIAACDRDCPNCNWCEDNLLFEKDVCEACVAHSAADSENKAGILLKNRKGLAIRIWLAIRDPNRPPACMAKGMGVYYKVSGDVEPSVIQDVIERVAGLLEEHSGDVTERVFLDSMSGMDFPGDFRFLGNS